jgi:ribosomal protein L14
MKKNLFLAGILGMALVFGFVLASCGDGAGGDGSGNDVDVGGGSVTYFGSADDDAIYILVITGASGRYAAKTGDSYVLTVNPGNKTSTGTVTVSGSDLTLNSSKGTATFTVTITSGSISAISGTTITFDDNSTVPVPNITPDGKPLPVSSGSNELSGKTYFIDFAGYGSLAKIEFSAASTGSGTYTSYHAQYGSSGWVLNGKKYVYIDTEKGSYTWNATAKTVTLKPGQIKRHDGYTWSSYCNRAAYIALLMADMDKYTDADILAETGMSRADSIIFDIAESFGNKTYGYSFSNDNQALFLTESVLAANKGTNELSGKTFSFQNWNNNRQVVFTASSYTLTSKDGPTVTGTYIYDSVNKWVYLTPAKADAKDISAYYNSLPGTGGDASKYLNANDYKAALTNEAFRVEWDYYDLSDNSIRG